jgi:glycosyltransferase involved in cell wall biosynthesis
VVKTVAFAVPGDLSTPTGGYTYDRRIIAELGVLGWKVNALDIGNDFPRPQEETRMRARSRLRALPRGQPVVIDGLAYGVMEDEARELVSEHPLVALVHHPLALETGLSSDESDALLWSERAALALAHRVIVTSPATARLLVEDYAVPQHKLTVVQPGTDRPDRPIQIRVKSETHSLTLLAVGAVVPRKGYDLLVAALARLHSLPWRLVIVGDRERSPELTRMLDAEIARLAFGDRITFTGAIPAEQVAPYYAAADLFVLPSRFEGYGMAYTEAIAHGVPVVATTAGAIPHTVPAGAGILVPPDDVEALAEALRRLIAARDERARLAAAARIAAATLPTWAEQGKLFARVLGGLR